MFSYCPTLRPLHKLRQLRDVHRNAPRLVPGQEIGRRSPARFLLVIHIRERVAVPILHDEAIVVMVFDDPGRREAAGGSGHATEGPLSSLPPLLRACFMLAVPMASGSCRCSGRKYPALTSFAIISFGKGTTSSPSSRFLRPAPGPDNHGAKGDRLSGRRLRPRQSEGLPRAVIRGSALPSSKYRADGSYLQRKAEVKKDRAMLNGVAGAYDTPQDRLSGFFLGFDLDDEINVVSDGAQIGLHAEIRAFEQCHGQKTQPSQSCRAGFDRLYLQQC